MSGQVDILQMPCAPAALIHRLNAAGFEAFAVGGCVRDTLLGLSPDDWDITTSATPEQTKAVFADCRVIETGLQHGTVTVRYEHQNYEITTYRVDGSYHDNRHPDAVSFTNSLFEDVKRRDFTVNAMVWHPAEGIGDFFDGQTDLKNKVLRTVGDPIKRFSEDALRILRLLRFSATYGLTAEPQTKSAACALASHLQNIAVERVRVELEKLLCGDFAAAVIGDFAEIWQVILPEVDMTSVIALQKLPKEPVLRWAYLLQDAPAEAILRRLKADNATISQVCTLINGRSLSPTTDRISLKHALHRYGETTLRGIIALQSVCGDAARWAETEAALQTLLKTKPCYRLKDLQITGEHLLSCGLQGRKVGEMLEYLLTAVMEETCENETGALLTLVKQNI